MLSLSFFLYLIFDIKHFKNRHKIGVLKAYFRGRGLLKTPDDFF
jgi:hypothetical protein